MRHRSRRYRTAVENCGATSNLGNIFVDHSWKIPFVASERKRGFGDGSLLAEPRDLAETEVGSRSTDRKMCAQDRRCALERTADVERDAMRSGSCMVGFRDTARSLSIVCARTRCNTGAISPGLLAGYFGLPESSGITARTPSVPQESGLDREGGEKNT